jgi:hypothetical protein
MYVLTADQVDSRHGDDLVETALRMITERIGDRLVRPPERTAGDELQAAIDDPAAALDAVLALARDGRWSVGLGIGDVRRPLPDSTRAMGGPAFLLAREAVTAAKRRPTRFAAAVDVEHRVGAAVLEPVVDLLLLLRRRRTPEGWELYDLLETGLSQAEAAERLDITPQAASGRALAAGLRVDVEARAALVELLTLADERIAS